MVSAIKKDGVPLYKLARKGIGSGARAAADSHLQLSLHSYEEPIATFRLACTKGTYVRSVAHELGQKLGCGAHLATLRRVTSGKFDVAEALPLDQILSLPVRELEKRVIPFLKLAAGG